MMNDQKDKSPELGNLSITLLDSNDQLMPGESPACRMTLKNIMDKYRIEVQNNAVVTEVTSTDVLVACYNDGKKENKPISYTCCIWATGAEGMNIITFAISNAVSYYHHHISYHKPTSFHRNYMSNVVFLYQNGDGYL